MVYGSVATGYKGGGVNPRPFFGPSAGSCTAPGYVAPAPCNQLGSFRPETLLTYEFGFKSDFADRRVRLNGAVFFNNYDDMILQLSACPSAPCLKPTNVGKAKVKGVELETTIRPIDGFTIDGSLSYIDFQYKTVGTSGIPLTAVTPYTPEWTYSFGAQYDHDIGRARSACVSTAITSRRSSPSRRIRAGAASRAISWPMRASPSPPPTRTGSSPRS